jgi:hypothetical protein
MFNGSKIVVLMQVMKLITGRVKEKQARRSPLAPYGVSINGVYPKNGWFIRENPIKMDDWVPPF